MTRSKRRWLAVAGPLIVLVLLAARFGTGPFLAGIRAVDGKAIVIAALLAVLTTVCCAWRWTVVARGLGCDLPMRGAIAAYYRSLFLNVTVPGGVVGDIHRGLTHGREVANTGAALRAVAWERGAGQFVQALIAVPILLVLPSPVHSVMPWAAVATAVIAVAIVIAGGARPAGTSRWARIRRTVAEDLRDGLIARRAWPQITLASALIVAGHVATFVLAARTAGVKAPLSQLLPIAFLALTAMVLPSIGGWGPREGVTAWAFGAAGLGVQSGLATAVVYGVLVIVATLPGAVVLAVTWRHGRRPEAERASVRTRQRTPELKRRAAHV
jgi:glycosyltransferase 2 family protein